MSPLPYQVPNCPNPYAAPPCAVNEGMFQLVRSFKTLSNLSVNPTRASTSIEFYFPPFLHVLKKPWNGHLLKTLQRLNLIHHLKKRKVI